MTHLKYNFSLAVILLFVGIQLSFGVELPRVDTTKNPVIMGNKRITLITPTLIRLEYALDQDFLDEPTMFAYQRDSLLKDFRIQALDNGKRYEITTSKIRMVVDNDNLPYGQQNTFFYFTKDGEEKKISARSLHSKTKNLNLGGSISTLDGVQGDVALNDGLLSSDGWYFIIDTGKEILTDGWFKRRSDKHIQDQYCFVYGNDFHEPFRDLGVISGKVPMTRKYMHGIWYSRWWPFTEQETYDLVDGFNRHDFPLDIISLDMDWHLIEEAQVGVAHNYTKGWTGYTWNRKTIPQPKRLIGNLLADNIHVCLNEHPHDGIRPHESMYKDFMHDMELPADSTSLIFDASSKKYMTNFLKHAHKESNDMGVAFWWLDWQQDWLYPYVRGTYMRHVQWLNKLYFEASMFDNRRGANYSRWGGWGDHRYPLNFSGDAEANWDVLKFEVKLSQTSGNAGCYYWIHDTGGFNGGRDPEMLTRWTQFSALTAALRTHSSRSADTDRRPWLWGEKAEEAMRITYHFRAMILPYIYSSVWQTHNTMLPLNRCMFVDYSEQKNAYGRYNQFKLGELLLAAPITQPGTGENCEAEQTIWFPEDADWYDYFTDERHQAGSIDKVKKDLYSFPVFVKGGQVLPMQTYHNRPASAPLDTLLLRIYPGNNISGKPFVLYEDDGISQQYLKGNYATTDLSYNQKENQCTLTIASTKGNYQGQFHKRAYIIELAGYKEIKNVLVNGKKMKRSAIHKEERCGRYYLHIPTKDIREKTVVRFEQVL